MIKIMKKKLDILSMICLLLLTSCYDEPQKETFISKRIVILGLDGISVDGLNTAKTPNLDHLFTDGVMSLTTRNVMPSVTLPNWTSHLTGSGPEQHGVLNNGWRLDNIKLPAIEKDQDGYYPSVFKLLKDSIPGMQTAFYYNWKELINSMNPKYFDEYGFEENDGYLKNYSKAFKFIKENQDRPTLVFLYSVHTDHAGHNHGWMSPEYINSIEEVDVQIGRFIDKMVEEGLYDDTNFMFFTDHGGDPAKGHGGLTQQELEVPWAITGPGIRKGKLTEPNNSVNTATTIAHMFGIENIPLSWTGEVPMSIFD